MRAEDGPQVAKKTSTGPLYKHALSDPVENISLVEV
jgi:hypothetical protein